ncbi:E1-like protein-activating [Martensiomyces pterosporus]|nr:E1-like protein-activating [Martensiomyces pterosporus]
MSEILRFEPFSSMAEPEFWAGLAHHKLHSARLDTTRTAIWGEFSGGRRHAVRGSGQGDTGHRLAVPARLRVSKGSWDSTISDATSDGAEPRGTSVGPSAGLSVAVGGVLYNTNTIEEFKSTDKGSLLRKAGAEILDDIRSGRATVRPELMWSFVLLSFSDLKKYRFHHWFAFPAITADPPDTVDAAVPVAEFVSAESELVGLGAAFNQLAAQSGGSSQQHPPSCGAFLVEYTPSHGSGSGSWRVGALAEWDSFFGNKDEKEGSGSVSMLGFIDPSSHSVRPGWPLRNLLTWLRHCHPDMAKIKVLCYRDALVAPIGGGAAASEAARPQHESIISGWERNEKQKLVPRMANLSSTMDPVRLAESALELNLQLMRWRLAPSIDLARISSTKVLLIGAGTLGAYTARALLAWGVRKITFVDNGRVSFSNPVRQPLYTFADSLEGGRPKAEAAAESMRQIFPNVDATGVQLSIPMPGHAVSSAEVESTRQAVSKLEELVAAHDAVFLLTDSRESRWLPTMLGALHRKLVLCVALGFDSYVAMRHGVYPEDSRFVGNSGNGARLGCYFCNDVVAPTDSLTDRTLDQQCTVTRPGLAPIASGTAVELLATIIQHPLGGLAPPPSDPLAQNNPAAEEGVFGAPEHQIRGYLAGFRQHAIVGHAYDMCTACSPKVIGAYREYGYEFLLRAFNNTLVSEDEPHAPITDAASASDSYSYLETLTGLAALHRQTDDILDDIEWSEDSGDDFEAV